MEPLETALSQTQAADLLNWGLLFVFLFCALFWGAVVFVVFAVV